MPWLVALGILTGTYIVGYSHGSWNSSPRSITTGLNPNHYVNGDSHPDLTVELNSGEQRVFYYIDTRTEATRRGYPQNRLPDPRMDSLYLHNSRILSPSFFRPETTENERKEKQQAIIQGLESIGKQEMADRLRKIYHIED